ncbi:DUF4306 domain-containing protein [Guptibacillus hwajinpoensis]|uniref:DUF4306 domain-containing protein n=1 Tax=Guptibacillus hwajinpoensis TaxID=208199 RepID=UPI001CFE70B7|nr:DUF4306 domain-containing protein [Pseudalkalibacillus hwajinpoensis]
MMNIVKGSTALVMLVLSTLGSWYEGSELRNKPWEWEYSTFFSRVINGQVTGQADISSLDHFIYAAKFKPLFPILMVVSGIYLLTFLFSFAVKHDRKKLKVYYGSLGMGLLLASCYSNNSPTIGLEIISWLLITVGLLNIGGFLWIGRRTREI